MDLKLSYCTLPVHDHDAALAFYRDVLGFEVRRDVQSAGMRWVSVGPRAQPSVRIALEPSSAEPAASPGDREAIENLMAKGLLSRCLVFATDDCDATFERIEASGAEVIQEPIDQPSGMRDCAFFDPSGNLLRFAQPCESGR